MQKEMDEQIDNMLEKDVITPSKNGKMGAGGSASTTAGSMM